jgi:hypothetical protein
MNLYCDSLHRACGTAKAKCTGSTDCNFPGPGEYAFHHYGSCRRCGSSHLPGSSWPLSFRLYMRPRVFFTKLSTFCCCCTTLLRFSPFLYLIYPQVLLVVGVIGCGASWVKLCTKLQGLHKGCVELELLPGSF